MGREQTKRIRWDKWADKKENKKKKEKRYEERRKKKTKQREREKKKKGKRGFLLLPKIYGDQTVGFRRSKMQSSSTR